MISTRIYQALYESVSAALILATIAVATFVLYEPVTGRAQVSDTFIITQDITGEISFLVAAADVSMVGSIAGITGGEATGSTFAVVETNDPDGYNMTIQFPYATTTGMDGDATAAYIGNYVPASTTIPDYGWVDNGASGESQFGYTVSASTTADLGLLFRNNGSVCSNNSGGDVVDQCWYNATPTAVTIVNRTSGSAPTGATTTITFRVFVPSNPSPALDVDTYTATATLTATNN